MRAKQVKQVVIVVASLAVAAWLACLIWELSGKARIAISEEREARRQLAALENRKATLEATLEELQTERGQDGAIRTAFGVAKAGEELIVVIPPEEPPEPPPKSWWRRWFGWF
jgi:hypothetical protein